MSDDGTKAAKKIAYSIEVEGSLAKLKYQLTEMLTYSWSPEDQTKLATMLESIDNLLEDANDMVDSYYKVLGEA